MWVDVESTSRDIGVDVNWDSSGSSSGGRGDAMMGVSSRLI